MATVTPWEVKGNIDYDKLIKNFGLKPLKNLPEIFQKQVLFRREIIFAHRDFKRIVDAVENNDSFVMMTGLMPSGKFHFGHKMVADQIIFYQNLGAKVYLTVADIEEINPTNFEDGKNPEKESFTNMSPNIPDDILFHI